MAGLDSLSTRERSLVTTFGAIFAGIIVVLVPLRVSAWLAGREKQNGEIRDTIAQVQAARGRIALRRLALGDVAARYYNRAPPLGVLVDTSAKAAGLEIAVQSDAQPVQRGKLYSERATKLSIQKTGLRALTTFLERIELSGFPVAVTQFDMSRRIEPDAYTVSMTISAFDRNDTAPSGAPGR